jgi:molecular chaperone DnaK
MEGTDPEAIESATQTLTTASHKLAEEMYKKASATAAASSGTEAGGGTGAGETKTDEKVVDAEFEEVDKDKK